MTFRTTACGVAALLCLSAVSTQAAEAPKPDSKKKSLYVTIRKRAEPEKSIPQTVQVFRKEQISDARIQSPTDISAQVSGFSFNDPFGRFNPAPSMRGLIQPGLGDEPSVAFFNDGMYLSGRSSINSLAFDLDRIEVAKGPQSALYGRNSFGGAINAISAKPSQQVERSIDVTVGSKDRKQVTGVISGPINDVLSARLALYDRDWGGFFKNSISGGGPNIGGEKTMAGRATLRYQPDATRDVILRLTHLHDADEQPKGFLVAANCGPRVGDGVLRYYCGSLPESGAPYEANDVGDNGYTRTHTRLGLDWNETLSDTTSLAFTFGGSTEDAQFARDDDYSAQQAARAGIDTRRNDLQADARLTYTPTGKTWDAIVGTSFYRFFNHTHRTDQYYILGQTAPGGPVANAVTDTAAVYGSLGIGLPENFKLTLDGRYQKEWKSLEENIIVAGAPLDLSDSWTAFTPKVTLSWQRSPESLLVYASAGKGYKSGGFNDRLNIFGSERTYGPEQNWTYEAGLKNIPLARGLALDLSAFYIDWQDQQVLAYSGAGATNNFFLNNNAQSSVKGIETGLQWQATQNTHVGFYYTYADARFEKYNDPDLAGIVGYAPTGDVSGKQLPRYSPHHIGVDISNRVPLDYQHWHWLNTAQFTFQSSQYTDNANLASTGNRSILNLQTGLSDGPVYAGFFIDNALNERDPPVGISWSDATTGFSRAWLVVPQDGRTFGIRAKMKF